MDKKYLLLAGVVIVILCVVGAYLYFNNNSSNVDDSDIFTVGPANFSLPDGYNVTETKNNSAKISNGINTVTVVCYNDKNIKKYINKYVSKKEADGYGVNVSNYSVSKHTVYKSELSNDTCIIHYWFKHENKTYSIYSQDANKHMNNLVNQLIKSMKTDKNKNN